MDLKKRVDQTFERKEQERKLKERARSYEKVVSEAPAKELKEFFCENCDEDFIEVGLKIEIDFYMFAYYRAQCPKCKKDCQRFINEVQDDPYFYKSRKLREERQKHYIDLLQPGDVGFETYYGKKHKEN